MFRVVRKVGSACLWIGFCGLLSHCKPNLIYQTKSLENLTSAKEDHTFPKCAGTPDPDIHFDITADDYKNDPKRQMKLISDARKSLSAGPKIMQQVFAKNGRVIIAKDPKNICPGYNEDVFVCWDYRGPASLSARVGNQTTGVVNEPAHPLIVVSGEDTPDEKADSTFAANTPLRAMAYLYTKSKELGQDFTFQERTDQNFLNDMTELAMSLVSETSYVEGSFLDHLLRDPDFRKQARSQQKLFFETDVDGKMARRMILADAVHSGYCDGKNNPLEALREAGFAKTSQEFSQRFVKRFEHDEKIAAKLIASEKSSSGFSLNTLQAGYGDIQQGYAPNYQQMAGLDRNTVYLMLLLNAFASVMQNPIFDNSNTQLGLGSGTPRQTPQREALRRDTGSESDRTTTSQQRRTIVRDDTTARRQTQTESGNIRVVRPDDNDQRGMIGPESQHGYTSDRLPTFTMAEALANNDISVSDYMAQFNEYRVGLNRQPMVVADHLIHAAAQNNPYQLAIGRSDHRGTGGYAEIAYLGPRSIASAIKGWHESPGHRAIMTGNYRCTGIHVIKDSVAGWAWTQTFSNDC